MSYLIDLLPTLIICLTIIILGIILIKKINIFLKLPFTIDHFETTISALNNIIGSFYSIIIYPKLHHLEPIKFDKDGNISKEFKEKSSEIFKINIDILIKTYIPIELYKNCSNYYTPEYLGIYIYNKFGLLSKSEEN